MNESHIPLLYHAYKEHAIVELLQSIYSYFYTRYKEKKGEISLSFFTYIIIVIINQH